MRVDGVAIWISNPSSKLVNSSDLVFNQDVPELTGEVRKKVASYRGAKITVFPEKGARINVSLHKYFNNGEHNYNELSHADLVEVIHDLFIRFGIDPQMARITRIEIGVNINPEVPTKDLLTALILHKTNPFYVRRKQGMNFHYVEHKEYDIKAYDKGLQHNATKDIFRFEIAARKRWRKKIGIDTLADLLDQTKYNNLGKFIIDEFGKIFILDPYHPGKMEYRDVLNYYRYQNLKYWEKLSPDYKPRRLNDARKYAEKHGLNSIHQSTKKLIEHQIELNQAVASYHPRFFTELGDGVDQKFTPPAFHSYGKKVTKGTSSLLVRKCVVSGADISMQHPSSRHLSPVGLRYLQSHDPEAYQDIIRRFGPYDESLDNETNLDRIAHRIRNFVSNQWRDMRNLETKYQGNYSMFTDQWLLGPRAILALTLENNNKIQGNGI